MTEAALLEDRPMTDLTAWRDATADLRARLYKDAAEDAERKLRKSRGSKKWTATQDQKVANAAKGHVVRKLAALAQYNGVRNPIHDDPEWGPNAGVQIDGSVADLAAWLAEQTWSDFAQSLAEQFSRTGKLSDKQVASGTSMRTKVEARNKAKAEAPKPKPVISSNVTGIDLAELPSGYYAVPNGDTRLKVRISRPGTASKWHGWTFVNDGAAYGERRDYGRQAPSGLYQGQIEDQLRAIVADPQEAMAAYGRLTGKCGNCHRLLEDEVSIERGIGPVCWGKLGY
jgi:hypothetical protein